MQRGIASPAEDLNSMQNSTNTSDEEDVNSVQNGTSTSEDEEDEEDEDEEDVNSMQRSTDSSHEGANSMQNGTNSSADVSPMHNGTQGTLSYASTVRSELLQEAKLQVRVSTVLNT